MDIPIIDLTTLSEDDDDFTIPDNNNPPSLEPPDFIDLQYSEMDRSICELPAPPETTFEPISQDELVVSQLNDQFCSEIRRRLNEGEGIAFEIDENGLLIRVGEHGPQIVVPHSLKQKILHVNHYAKTAGHPGGRKLYQRIRRHFYWPALAVDCYATVKRCPHCASNRFKLRQNVSELQLFPANAPLESVSIDILAEFIRTPRGKEYLLVIVDRFTKLVKTVPMKGCLLYTSPSPRDLSTSRMPSSA